MMTAVKRFNFLFKYVIFLCLNHNYQFFIKWFFDAYHFVMIFMSFLISYFYQILIKFIFSQFINLTNPYYC